MSIPKNYDRTTTNQLSGGPNDRGLYGTLNSNGYWSDNQSNQVYNTVNNQDINARRTMKQEEELHKKFNVFQNSNNEIEQPQPKEKSSGIRYRDLSVGTNKKILKRGLTLENNFLGRSDAKAMATYMDLKLRDGGRNSTEKNSELERIGGIGAAVDPNATRNYNKPWLANTASNKDISRAVTVRLFWLIKKDSMESIWS